jgi:hypothetical protein
MRAFIARIGHCVIDPRSPARLSRPRPALATAGWRRLHRNGERLGIDHLELVAHRAAQTLKSGAPSLLPHETHGIERVASSSRGAGTHIDFH